MTKTAIASAKELLLWQENSQNALGDALERVETALTRYAATLGDTAGDTTAPLDHGESIPPIAGAPTVAGKTSSALHTLCTVFGLSDWERDTLVLCAGVELSASFAALCARINGDPRAAYATFGIALAVLPNAHWDALQPEAPLRAWQLTNVGGVSVAAGGGWGDANSAGISLTRSPLRADERIIHYLTGIGGEEEDSLSTKSRHRTTPLLPIPVRMTTESQKRLSAQLAALLGQQASLSSSLFPVPILSGTDPEGCEAVAASAASQHALPLYRLEASELSAWGTELSTRLVLLQREARLHPFALLLDLGESGGENTGDRHAVIRRFVERYDNVLFLRAVGEEKLSVPRRTLVPIEVPRPSVSEQADLWKEALRFSDKDTTSEADDGMITRLASQFSLSSAQIQVAAVQGGSEAGNRKRDDNARQARLWEACRLQARPQLDNLALRIESRNDWEDLVLPEMQKTLLQDLLAHVRHRQIVHEAWGWAKGNPRGLGLSALFAGTSGTGKTLAAEVIAGALHLDLYRVDLSQTISKYIGETEKNLGRIFDAAEVGSVILLFDEADALFGKRSEVQDSHDRYANIEVSYLLQRMEQYRGLAILTTNMKNALDVAFLRRLRFVINFPFPDAVQREAIWRRAFPRETPTKDLSFARLAQWSVAGGNIKSAALNASFLAADDGSPVQMSHLMRAVQIECAKLDRPLIDAEVAGWVSHD